MAETSASIALSWPNTTFFRSRSSVFSALRSSDDTFLAGMRAILATISSISVLPITFFCFDLGRIFCAAPASSITSIALSGRWRSLMKRAESSAAVVSAAGAYLTPWCCSKRVFRPLRISIVSAIEGSGTSTFWKRRDSAWSFSKICRYSLYVVAPMHFSAPVDSAGFSRLDASSVPPDAAPAPMIVWISSMKRIDFGIVGELLQHRLQALLEVAAVLGAGKQRAHVERVHLVFAQQLGHVALVDAAREPSAIAVLPTPASPTSSGLFLRRRHSTWITRSSSCSRPISGSILPALASALRLMRVGVERALRLAAVLVVALRLLLFLLLLRRLGDAVRDVVDDVEPRHAALVQEIDGVRFLLAEDRDQHVGAGDFLLARRLDVQDRALDDALEALRGLRVGVRVRRQPRRVLPDEVGEDAAQLVEVDAAGLQHLGRRRVVEHREQQVLDGDELVLLLPGLDKGHVEGDFQFLRNHRPSFTFVRHGREDLRRSTADYNA